jgi:hypothetical protein
LSEHQDALTLVIVSVPMWLISLKWAIEIHWASIGKIADADRNIRESIDDSPK